MREMPPTKTNNALILPEDVMMRQDKPHQNRSRIPKHIQRFTSTLATAPSSPRSKATLPTLPAEIILNVLSYLDRVTSASLGLSCYRLYLLHFLLHGKVRKEEVTTWLVEVEEGPFAGKARMGWQVLGPMTVIWVRSLEELVGGRGMGGRVWDARVGWFRRVEVEGGKGDKIREKDAVMKGIEEDKAKGEAEERHGTDAKRSGTNEETRVVHLKQAVECLHAGILRCRMMGKSRTSLRKHVTEELCESHGSYL